MFPDQRSSSILNQFPPSRGKTQIRARDATLTGTALREDLGGSSLIIPSYHLSNTRTFPVGERRAPAGYQSHARLFRQWFGIAPREERLIDSGKEEGINSDGRRDQGRRKRGEINEHAAVLETWVKFMHTRQKSSQFLCPYQHQVYYLCYFKCAKFTFNNALSAWSIDVQSPCR